MIEKERVYAVPGGLLLEAIVKIDCAGWRDFSRQLSSCKPLADYVVEKQLSAPDSVQGRLNRIEATLGVIKMRVTGEQENGFGAATLDNLDEKMCRQYLGLDKKLSEAHVFLSRLMEQGDTLIRATVLDDKQGDIILARLDDISAEVRGATPEPANVLCQGCGIQSDGSLHVNGCRALQGQIVVATP